MFVDDGICDCLDGSDEKRGVCEDHGAKKVENKAKKEIRKETKKSVDFSIGNARDEIFKRKRSASDRNEFLPAPPITSTTTNSTPTTTNYHGYILILSILSLSILAYLLRKQNFIHYNLHKQK